MPVFAHRRASFRAFASCGFVRTQAFDSVWSFVSKLPKDAPCTLYSTGERPRRLGALDGERKDVEKKVGQGFAIEGPNALMDTVVEAAGALARESGKRRVLVVLSGWSKLSQKE